MRNDGEPVEVMTMSDSGQGFGQTARRVWPRPPRSAGQLLRPLQRAAGDQDLARRRSPGGRAAVSLPASPALITSTQLVDRSPSVWRARATAVELTDTTWWPIAVSLRARRPTRIAEWKSRDR